MNPLISDFIKELGAYDPAFGALVDARGTEEMRGRIEQFLDDIRAKDSEAIRPWDRIMTDIAQSQAKIVRRMEEVRTVIARYPVWGNEYEGIMADKDGERKKRRLKDFLTDRSDKIRGMLVPGGNLEKRAQALNSADDMLEMRKDLYVDSRNIAEALSLLLLEHSEAKQAVRALLEKETTGETEKTVDILPEQQGEMAVFANALTHMLRVLSYIEEYQETGLSHIRHLEDIDRHIVYMLTWHSSQTYRP